MSIDESRRDALQKLLVGAGVGLGAPIITTIGSGAAAAVVSGKVNRFAFLSDQTAANTDLPSGTLTQFSSATISGLDSCLPSGWASGTNDTVNGDSVSSSFTVTRSGNTATFVVTIQLPASCTNPGSTAQSASVQFLKGSANTPQCLSPPATLTVTGAGLVTLNFSTSENTGSGIGRVRRLRVLLAISC